MLHNKRVELHHHPQLLLLIPPTTSSTFSSPMLLMRRAFRLLGLPNINGGTKSENNMSDRTFIPDPANVLDVKATLWQKRLPVELIESIIDFAEYWPRLVVEVETTIAVTNNGNILYLQSPPLPGLFSLEGPEEDGTREEIIVGGVEASTLNPARRVVFRITSHDQGWSSNLGQGTYRGSHSWFETFAERPLSIPAVQSAALLPGPADIDGEAKLRELQSSDGNQLWETVAISETVKGEGGLAAVVTEKTVWHLQRNVHAERSFKEHEVVWTWTDNDSDQDVDPEAEEEDTGKGKGGNFVRHLRPGYRIRVAARAQYPGWANHVQKMQLEIFYAI